MERNADFFCGRSGGYPTPVCPADQKMTNMEDRIMFKKIVDAFKDYTNRYADDCAKNSVYNVYVDMVRDLMNENEQ